MWRGSASHSVCAWLRGQLRGVSSPFQPHIYFRDQTQIGGLAWQVSTHWATWPALFFVTFITDVFLAWLIPQSVSISLGKPQNLLVLDPFLNISVWKPLPQSWGLPVVKCMWNLLWYMGELRIISNFSHMAGPHIAYCLISRSPWIFLMHSLLISIISVRTWGPV